MTATDTSPLAELMASRKADITGQPTPEPDYIPPADPRTGEIVPAAAEGSPMPEGQDGPPPNVPAAPAPEPLVHYPEVPPKVIGGLPYIREYVKLARTIMMTEMVPKAFQGRYDAITAAFMRGYELGLGPMQALDSFNVIEGKVGLSAEAMRALIMQEGHLFILSEDVASATVTCRRGDWPQDIPNATYTYDMDDAKTAGLLRESRSGKPTGWQKNPRAMLAARATSGAARAYFADVLAGMSYTPEEIRDFDGPAEQEALPSEPNPPTPPAAPAPDSSVSEPPAALSVDSTDGASVASDVISVPPTEPTTPKRPRGRPRKTESPASSTSTTPSPGQTESDAPPSSPAAQDSGPPETTSLNDGQVGVDRSMRSAYREIVAGLPTVQQPLCRAFVGLHFPNRRLEDLSESEIQKAIDIAVGWPDSADQHPLPDDGQQDMGL